MSKRTSRLMAIVAALAAQQALATPVSLEWVDATPRSEQAITSPILSPLVLIAHDGSVDVFDQGTPASTELALLASEGLVAPLIAQVRDRHPNASVNFLSNSRFGDLAGEPVVQHQARRVTLDPNRHRYLSFVAKLTPSDDAFVGNDDPRAFPLFDADGQWLGGLAVALVLGQAFDAGVFDNSEVDAMYFDRSATRSAVPSVGQPIAEFAGYRDGFLRRAGAGCTSLRSDFPCIDLRAAAAPGSNSPLGSLVAASGWPHSLVGVFIDPRTPGQGFTLQPVFQTAQQMLATWYTFSPAGQGDPYWLLGSGAVLDGRGSLRVDRYRGAGIGAPGVAGEHWGSLELEALDCVTVLARLHSNDAGIQAEYRLLPFNPRATLQQDKCSPQSIRLSAPADEDWPDAAPIAPDVVPPALSAITHAQVIQWQSEGARVLADHAVVFARGRIVQIVPSSALALPAGSRVFDAQGRYLLPGLVDAHVHMSGGSAASYVDHGVTSVRNLWGYSTLPALKARIDAFEVDGPTIYSYSPGIDGPPARWPETRLVQSEAQARDEVREFALGPWIGIKAYDGLAPAHYAAVLDEGRKLGVHVVGHVPHSSDVGFALAQGQRTIEHLMGYAQLVGSNSSPSAWAGAWNRNRFRDLARTTAQSGAYNCPTLAVQQRLTPASHAGRLEAVRILYQEGARLLAGSDAGIDITAPGAGLWQELIFMQDAGLPPAKALQTASRDVADAIGQSGRFGSIAVGASADLILLDRDPLISVSNVRSLHAVLQRGRWTRGPWVEQAPSRLTEDKHSPRFTAHAH